MLALHPRSTRVHIGCDEPTLGLGVPTREAAAADADGVSGVLIEHVARTVNAARALGRDALMWHDAAVNMSDGCLTRLLAAGATLVVWDYGEELAPASPAFADRLLQQLAARSVGGGASGGASNRAGGGAASPPWLATAYKGGDACDAVVPREDRRAANQSAWRNWAEAAPEDATLARLGISRRAPRRLGGVVRCRRAPIAPLAPLAPCEAERGWRRAQAHPLGRSVTAAGAHGVVPLWPPDAAD